MGHVEREKDKKRENGVSGEYSINKEADIM